MLFLLKKIKLLCILSTYMALKIKKRDHVNICREKRTWNIKHGEVLWFAVAPPESCLLGFTIPTTSDVDSGVG